MGDNTDDLEDAVEMLSGNDLSVYTGRTSNGRGYGRGKSYTGSFSFTTPDYFGQNLLNARYSRRKRFVGNLMTLPNAKTIDTARFPDPMDAVVELIHEVQRNHGRRENYTLFAGNRAHYWITGPDMDERQWITTALGEGSPSQIRGVTVKNADNLVPSTVMVMLNEDQIRYNGVVDHPIAIGLNAGADRTISLGLDAEGSADITWVGPDDLPHDDHPWIPGEPEFPRIPEESALYDEAEEPNPRTKKLRFMVEDDIPSPTMEANEMVDAIDRVTEEAEEAFTERYARRTTGDLMDELVESTAHNAMVRTTYNDDSEQ